MLGQFYSSFVNSEKKKAILYMIIGSLFISIGPFFVEFSHVSAETNTFYRLLVGSIFFLLFSYFKSELKVEFKFLLFSMIGGTLLVLDLFLWNQSVLYIGAGLSTVLSNLEIVFLIFIGKMFFKEKIPHKFFTQVSFIILGVLSLLIPVFPSFTPISIAGICFALCASLSYSLYLFFIKYISGLYPKRSSSSMLFVICFTGAFLLGTVIFIKDSSQFIVPSWHAAFCIFTNSILSQVIAWWFISKSIAQLKLSISGLILLIQPALTYILDCFFLGRNTHWLQLVGSLCLLSAVYLASVNQQEQKEIDEKNHNSRRQTT